MIKSTYIHIPFCKKKCNYCSFTSFEKIELKTIYVDSLLKEIDKFYDKTPQKTLYIGGGTPSILGVGDFEEILSKFNFENEKEITVEVNPESVTLDYLRELKNVGVNRLSIGIQSFNDEILKQVGRIHTSDEGLSAIKNAKKAGFENISIDLMYGLPNQDIELFKQDIKMVKSLDVEHISLYGLKIDKGCYFYKNRPDNIANEDIQADMYLMALDKLSPEYKRYEISNFSKNGEYKGQHNINYWKCGKYWGFGVSASGFLDCGRYLNPKNIEEYIKNPYKDKDFEKTNTSEEFIFLGLRMDEGIDLTEFEEKYNVNFEEKYKNVLDKYSNYFLKTKKGYKLTTNGLLVSNLILCEFLDD